MYFFFSIKTYKLRSFGLNRQPGYGSLVVCLSFFFFFSTHTLSQSFFLFSHFILSDRWRLPSRHLVYPVCTLPLGPRFAHILHRENIDLYMYVISIKCFYITDSRPRVLFIFITNS